MSNNQIMIDCFYSWKIIDGTLNSLDSILSWINKRNQDLQVRIKKVPFLHNGFWYYDTEEKGIVNRSRSFFKITGLRELDYGKIVHEQPIIIQNEIGFLGIIAKKIEGILYFLMQAKIEPGNVNKIQISPTIQATKSNFTKVHGGKTPAYLDFFLNEKKYEVIVDQIQSEQGSRFWGKRNRNIIILVEEDIEVLESHKWMTLGQIKQLMQIDNLVNMDTRTVISCIPFTLPHYSTVELQMIRSLFINDSLYNSMFTDSHGTTEKALFHYLNDVKMFSESKMELCDLFSLRDWRMNNDIEFSSNDADFKIIYADIEIEGREVNHWQQPLFESTGKSTFGLMYRINDSKMEFLVRAQKEIGCFDKVEIGPSVQAGPTSQYSSDAVEILFKKRLDSNKDVLFQGLFSEEGGRFYQEENKNVIMKVETKELADLPVGYFWVDYYILNHLVQYNNTLNIQLRNLLAILNL